MAASGGGGGSGGGRALPGLASVLRHMLDVDEDDFDCTIELVFPGDAATEAATQETEGPPAKRARLAAGTEVVAPSEAAEPAARRRARRRPQEPAGEPAAGEAAAAEGAAADGAATEAAAADSAAAEDAADNGVASEAAAADSVDDLFAAGEAAVYEALAAEGATAGGAAAETAAHGAAPTTIACRASSMALKLHIEVFRRWIKGWAGGQNNKVLRIECEDRQEAEAFQQLLAFVHSAGRTLPAEPLAAQHLLGVARKHGVESCVDACLQLLLAQVDQLPLPACLRLVLLLETGASGDEGVQAQADQLLKTTGERLQVLLKEGAAAVAADAALLEDLAAVFGRWHSMLNCAVRRELWRTLPFELLSLMFEDRHVQADTEATAAMLTAFALWANANIAVGPMAPQQRERVAAVCSRIRFPDVPPGVLLNYWAYYKWLQAYDPNKELLLRALATAADAEQRALWQSGVRAPPRAGDETDAAAAQAVAAECGLCWTPRAPALVSDTDSVTSQLQIDRPPTNHVYARSKPVFRRGYWWCGDVKYKAGSIGIYTRAACSVNLEPCTAAAPDRRTYGVKAAYKMVLQLGDGVPYTTASTRAFAPASILGWGNEDIKDSSGQPIPWERFWAADSPFLHDGRARLELTLSVPRS